MIKWKKRRASPPRRTAIRRARSVRQRKEKREGNSHANNSPRMRIQELEEARVDALVPASFTTNKFSEARPPQHGRGGYIPSTQQIAHNGWESYPEPTETGVNSGPRRPFMGRCRVCGEVGHMARNCDTKVCYVCAQPGHLANQCPSRQGEGNVGMTASRNLQETQGAGVLAAIQAVPAEPSATIGG